MERQDIFGHITRQYLHAETEEVHYKLKMAAKINLWENKDAFT
jgi:hypothetical protein